jgi:hypothetical protein
LRKHQGGSRSGLSGINRPVKNLNRNPRQPNQTTFATKSANKRLMHRSTFEVYRAGT